MKLKAFFTIIIPCVLLITIGCKKDFLDEKLYSNISSDNFWQNSNDAKAGLASAYTLALSYGPRDCRNFFLTTDMLTDDMDDAYNNTEDERRQLQNFNFSPNNSYFNNSWVSLYKTIAQTNAVIQNVPNIATMTTADKNMIVGEAKFLRALEYYYLVQQWGGVPLDTIEVKTIAQTQIPRATVDDVYSLIVRDLQFADANCGDAPPAAGRASKWAAKSLLAKVYLILAGPFDNRKQNWLQLAEGKLKEVISSNRFSLVPKIIDYFDINKKNNTEVIFDHYTIGDVSDRVGSFMHRNFLPGTISSSDVTKLATSGYGAWTPTTDLWVLYRPQDDRLNWYRSGYIKKNSDGTYKMNQYNVPYIFKYVDSNTVARDYKANNLPVLRYADVLLMYAEVLNELGTTGPSGNQYYYFNLVRKRAFSTNPNAYVLADGSCTQAQFRDTLMKERRLEFAHEGQRLFDLKRTGTYLTVMTALANNDKAQLASSPVPTFKGTYPGGVYPNPTGNVVYSAGTFTFTSDFLKNAKTVAPQPYQLLLPIPYLQLQAFDIGQNQGY